MSKIRVVQRKAHHSSSPYHAWIAEHGEPQEVALPVVDAESELLGDVLEAIDAGVERLLSNQERRAFQLVVREGMSFDIAAQIISGDVKRKVSKAAVQIYVKRAAKKIRDFVIRKTA